MFSVDNEQGHIYVKEGDDEDDGDKVGGAGHGGNRAKRYRKKAKKKRLPEPKLRSAIDIDNIPEPLQRELVRRVLAIASEFMCPEYPTTHRKLFARDMLGLPIGAQVFFRSIVKSSEECSVIGGGKAVWGFPRRAAMNMLEDGMQVALLEGGYPIDDRWSLHESVNGKVLSRYVRVDSGIRSNVAACMKAIHSKKERKRVRAESHKVEEVVLNFPPGRLASCPPKYEEAKISAKNNVFGEDCPVVDPFEHWPMPNPQNISECHDTRPYKTRPQLKKAFKRTVDRFRRLERNGGYGAFDVAKTLWEETKSGSMVDYLVNERVTVLGHEPGSGWYVAWTTTGIVVLRLDYIGDDEIRVIVVFIPWCYMIFSKGDAEVTWARLTSQEKSVMSAQWAYYFFGLLREENSTLVPDDSLDRLVENDIYLLWCIYLHDLQFNHLHKKAVGLKFKNALSGSKRDCFDPSFTNMLRNDNLDHIGIAPRRLQARLEGWALEEDEPEHVRRDNKFVRFALSLASSQSDRNLDEVVSTMVGCLTHDRHEHGLETTRGFATPRHNIIMSKTKDVHSDLLERFHTHYLATRNNSGNTSNNTSVTESRMVTTDDYLRYYHERCETKLGRFFVQGNGKAAVDIGELPLNNDGTPFEIPEDGTVLRPEKRGQQSVVFRRDRFVPGISHGGLLQRVKPANGSGRTKRRQSQKFPGYKIRWTDGSSGTPRRRSNS